MIRLLSNLIWTQASRLHLRQVLLRLQRWIDAEIPCIFKYLKWQQITLHAAHGEAGAAATRCGCNRTCTCAYRAA